MLKKLITEIVDPLLATLSPNWIDRYGGLVETLDIKEAIDPMKPDKTRLTRVPISCGVNQTECNDPTATYLDLVPNGQKSSIVYWEELSPMRYQPGAVPQQAKNLQKWSGKSRLVVWLNAAKLGVGTANANYSCGWDFPFQDEIVKLLTTEGKFTSGDFNGGTYKLQPTNLVPQNLSIFSKYTYDKYTNFYRYPYAYFAIDFDFDVTYCVGKNSTIPTGTVIPCPFTSEPTPLSNEYSMSLDLVDEYMEIAPDSSISFPANAPFSLSIWIKTAGNANQWLLSKKKGNIALNETEYQLVLSSGNQVALTLYDKNAIGFNDYYERLTASTIPLNTWVNVVAVNDGAVTKIYFNGVEQGTTNTSVGTYTEMVETTSPLTIGKAGWVSNLYYGGLMEELSIFNTNLNDAEVIELYNAGLPTNLNTHSKSANLAMWSRMGDGDTYDGTDWTLLDNSINNNTITTFNMEVGDRVTDVPT